MNGDAMQYSEDSPFYRLLATKYDGEREAEAIEILEHSPERKATVGGIAPRLWQLS